MQPETSQILDSYVPIYDAIPEAWEEAKTFLVERLKEHAIAINTREIGWYLDDELLSGKSFTPPAVVTGTSEQFRSILRKVLITGPLIAGLNVFPHDIVFDANFTLIQMWCSATDSVAFRATTISNEANLTMDATNVNVTALAAYDRSIVVIEYCQEL